MRAVECGGGIAAGGLDPPLLVIACPCLPLPVALLERVSLTASTNPEQGNRAGAKQERHAW